MIGQNCFGRWSPTILMVRSRSRIPSPPASRTAHKCWDIGGRSGRVACPMNVSTRALSRNFRGFRRQYVHESSSRRRRGSGVLAGDDTAVDYSEGHPVVGLFVECSNSLQLVLYKKRYDVS